jgi:hypothetical protein
MPLTRRSLTALIALAAVLQAVIILYNNATGYIRLGGPGDFLLRAAIGTAFSTPVALALLIVDSAIARLLDRGVPWEHRFLLRVALEGLLAVAAGMVLGMFLTLVVGSVFPYKDGLSRNLVNNGLIAAVVNLLITAGLEAAIAFHHSQEARVRAEALERQNAEIRFVTLKTQLNPHFLFNSLNVLTSLIDRDPAGAQRFVDEFASVYRYTLEVIELPVVEVSRELEFARSYLYLLGIRFGNAVQTELCVNGEELDRLLPPLALQIVIENAVKHNRASEESPLRIRIASTGEALTVANTLQRKQHSSPSTGIGLENLSKRYAYLAAPEPRFMATADEFVAVLPLLSPQ